MRGVHMRITGGEFGGRRLAVPPSDEIRPTQDRVRQALFNIIQGEVPGCDFLDLFAGSGAVGLEALSRGARSVVFVEQSRRHLLALGRNLTALAGSARPSIRPVVDSACRSSVICADAYRWIAAYAGPGFAIGFADPPYRLGEEKGYAQVLATLAARDVIRVDGLFIAEMTAVQQAEETPGWKLLRDRSYGRTRICIWRRLG
ncbi:MAG: 16S rRNA (guanine(966)-N(2))-methyltransferase RsmD [Kiritimatiellia bacterium]